VFVRILEPSQRAKSQVTELSEIFKLVIRDLEETSTVLKHSVSAKRVYTIQDAQSSFPEDLVKKLDFQETGEYIVIKQRQELDSDVFRRVASIIRNQLAGEYITTEKDAYFRVPHRE